MSDIYALQEREELVITHDFCLTLGCGQQQQKEALQSLQTRVGQENSVYLQQV